MTRNSLKHRLISLLVILIASGVMFYDLGAGTLHNWDEARFAVNTLEAIKYHDWVVFTYMGQPDLWHLKPPMIPWLMTLSFQLFGVTEYAVRFFSALFGVVTLFVVFQFTQNLRGVLAAALSALILLGNSGFSGFHGARTGDADAIVSCFITLSIFCCFRYQQSSQNRFLYFLALSLVFTVLSKGALVVFPVLIILVYLITQKSAAYLLKYKHFYFALLLFGGLALPWFVLRFYGSRDYFLEQFSAQFWQRVFGTLEEHGGDVWFYLRQMHTDMGTGIFITFGLAIGFSIWRYQKIKAAEVMLLSIWIFLILGALSAMQTKIAWYIIPVYPAVAIWLGISAADLAKLVAEKLRFSQTVFMLLITIMFLPGIFRGVQKNWQVYSFGYDEFLRRSNLQLQSIEHVYIQQDLYQQSTIFYLSAAIKGTVFSYTKIEEIAPHANDGVLTLKRGDMQKYLNHPDFETLYAEGKVLMFRRK